jgi:DNA-binding NtrC family response regulator
MLTILLVDHEPLQASLRKSVLENRFSDVRRVGDAAEALCLVEQPDFAASLGLVISGHHRPGISGPAFVAELLARMPSLPVLVLGGEGDTAEAYSGQSVRFLPRPVDSEEMLATASRMVVRFEVKTA